MQDDELKRFLKDEYLKLQDSYDSFDHRALTIKGWISAGSAAAIALSFDASGEIRHGILLSLIALSVTFWYLEARWKTFQWALRGRIKYIEQCFRGEGNGLKDVHPLQIHSHWNQTEPPKPGAVVQGPRDKNKLARTMEALREDFVMLPYIVVIILCAVLLVTA